MNRSLFAKYPQYENSKEVGIAIQNITKEIGRLQDKHSDLVDLMSMMVALENMGKKIDPDVIGSVGASWAPYQFDGQIKFPLTPCYNEFRGAVEMKIMKSRPRFMVTYEMLEEGVLKTCYFPDGGLGFHRENEAWKLAEAIAANARENVFNIYVVTDSLLPVAGYEEKKLRSR